MQFSGTTCRFLFAYPLPGELGGLGGAEGVEELEGSVLSIALVSSTVNTDENESTDDDGERVGGEEVSIEVSM
jgi:hypothetical protein